MSPSTPSATQPAWPERSDRLFWGLSLAVHGTAALILIAIPAREFLFTREIVEKRGRVMTRGKNLERIIDNIRDLTAERLRARIYLLKAGQKRMASNFETMNRYYQPFVSQQRRAARLRFDTYAGQVLERMDELRLLLEKADETKDAARAVEVGQSSIPRITGGQEEVRRGMVLLELADEELKKKQNDAEEAQFGVGPFLGWIRGHVASIERRRREIPEHEKNVKEFEKKIATGTRNRDATRVALAQAKKRLAEARSREKKEKDRNERNALRRKLKAVESEVRREEKRLRDTEGQLRRLSQEAARVRAQLEEHRTKLPAEVKKRDELISVARNIQGGAYWRQKEVIDAIRKKLEVAPAAGEGARE